ncbi:hypothetical protein HDV00_006915 [Rhizophlyctis rosea]|nr:hypothetical protein HDV00_006915 [Rhizophlyctis rosea]
MLPSCGNICGREDSRHSIKWELTVLLICALERGKPVSHALVGDPAVNSQTKRCFLSAYHVIIEFYASGNIILTDFEYKILALLRVVELEGTPGAQGQVPAAAKPEKTASTKPDGEEEDTRFAVGEIYKTELARPFTPITEEKLRQALASGESPVESTPGAAEPSENTEEGAAAVPEATGKKGGKGGKKKGADKAAKQEKWAKEKKKGKEATLKKFVRDKLGPDYGPALIEHCIARSGLDPNMKVGEDLDLTPESSHVAALLKAFQEGDAVVESCMKQPPKGYIVVKGYGKKSGGENDTPTATDGNAAQKEFTAYDEFHPYPFSQFLPPAFETDPLEFPTFDKAVDEFFSKLEAQKLEIRARQAEASAAKKLESVKAGHINQVKGLEMMKEESTKCAQAIEASLQGVDAVINTVRGFIASGMDWVDLSELINDEKKRGNPLAILILGLKLEVGMVTVGLRDPDLEEDDSKSDSESDDEEDDEEWESEARAQGKKAVKGKGQAGCKKPNDRLLKIDIDIYSSAYANARRYYDNKKVAVVKQEKTLQAAEKALKSAERKIQQELKVTQQTVAVIKKIRKPFWFEKFIWFISSENYLVVGGRDAGQNELLVRRYLNKGDVYVHADLHGAASVIVKNLSPSTLEDGSPAPMPPVGPDGTNIPPTTLHQAGTMSVCQSRAWDAKIVTSAWWVFDHQVSKTAPTGEYLTTGSFMIRGKKNWLPPVQLIYGFGILFKVDEESVARHYWERRPWARGEAGQVEESQESVAEVEEDVEVDGGEDSPVEGTEPVTENQNGRDGSGEEENYGADGEEGGTSTANGPDAVDKADSEDSDEDMEFPDTQIEIPAHTSLQQSEDKYNLAELEREETGTVVEGTDEAGQAKTGAKKLSAKERRDLKKQRKGGDTESGADAAASTSSRPTAAQQSKPSTPQQQTAVRGKRGKMKKAKDKYADQDEEDREMMLELLGSAKGRQPKGKKAKAEAARKEAEAAKQTQRKNQGGGKGQGAQKKGDDRKQAEVVSKPVEEDVGANEEGDDDDGVASEKGDQPGGTSRRNSTATDSAEIRKLLEEENVAIADDDQAANLSYLDSLTGQPHPLDNLQNAVAVCAPWAALQKYKYKVKLIPGALKKGKAAKSALAAFVAMATEGAGGGGSGGRRREGRGEDGKEGGEGEGVNLVAVAEREKELMKSIPEMELINAMMGKCKVMTAATEGKKKGGVGKKGGSKGR